jgi:UDP-N-acetylenolpyruvoylglucosamine reductase
LVIRNKSERIQIKPQKNIFGFLRKKDVKRVEVVIDSGVGMDKAIERLIVMGIVGLEKYRSFTGTVGAMVNNGEGKEYLKKVSILDEHGGVKSIGGDKKLGKNIVMDATYLLSFGETNNLGNETEKRKPKGVRVFEDIFEDEQLALGYPTRDAGYIVGEILNMKGYKKGKMMISNLDQNYVINKGGGTANEFLEIVEEIKTRAREAIGIELVEKVVRLGF